MGRGGLEVGFAYDVGEVRKWVLSALGRTKNGSAPGRDGISYRLIKAVRDTRLGRELVDEVVDNLVRGVIPPAWGEMRVVFIPKPGRDLTLTKSWRPLNLINCIEKLWEKGWWTGSRILVVTSSITCSSGPCVVGRRLDRKSTRLNSSHVD